MNKQILEDKLRAWPWLAFALITTTIVALVAPQQVGLLAWAGAKLSWGAFLGYWIDRSLFPYARPDNPQLLAYTKQSEDGGNLLLVVVNLDPVNMQHGWVTLPLADLGLPADAPYQVDDLLDGARYAWSGAANYVRLDPRERPAHVFKVR